MNSATPLSEIQRKIVALSAALGAAEIGGPLSNLEQTLLDETKDVSVDPAVVANVHAQIRDGQDPLGDLFYEAHDATTRRTTGTVYTPPEIVHPMIDWALSEQPHRIVDAGAGSGRYTAAVLRQNPDLAVLAVDLDPMATLMTRAIGATLGASNLEVRQADFTRTRIAPISGKTAYIGNPPYVRHHQIPPAAKKWATLAAAALGHSISGLAGLHAYFYLATASHAKPGDVGCYVTSAEWLDVNYGSVIRNLLTHSLGASELQIVAPTAQPFDGATTTAALVQFKVGTQPERVGFRTAETLDSLTPLGHGTPVSRSRLLETTRWSVFLKSRNEKREGFIELGEIARVHRGAVTGSNATWVLREASDLPEKVLFPSITRARELFDAGAELSTAAHLKRVIDLPTDLGELNADERKVVEKFIQRARRANVDQGYVAQNRRKWWSVGLKDPAPVLATYMARRPPAFVRNLAGARHINIAHGVYPRQPLSEGVLAELVRSLRSGVSLADGRTYAGGLTKFEPREMERLLVPDLATLTSYAGNSSQMDA